MNLELLFDADGLPAFELPDALAKLYPGSIGFDAPCVFANFVSTADGAVAIPTIPQSNKLIAAGNPADRFVMGLLRACADAVVVGSGTMAASPGGLWTAEQAYPDAADLFKELRASRGLPPEPEVVILSSSGVIDAEHPVFGAGAVLITTDIGAALLADSFPDAATLVSLGDGGVLIDPTAALGVLRARGHQLILHEGGPHVIGSFLEAGVVDELFLTISPLMVGRTMLDPRFALVEGADLLPGASMRLLGARKETDHLFLRYGILPR
jgi:riboflavin biosynthesis pyrimidine reductase